MKEWAVDGRGGRMNVGEGILVGEGKEKYSVVDEGEGHKEGEGEFIMDVGKGKKGRGRGSLIWTKWGGTRVGGGTREGEGKLEKDRGGWGGRA